MALILQYKAGTPPVVPLTVTLSDHFFQGIEGIFSTLTSFSVGLETLSTISSGTGPYTLDLEYVSADNPNAVLTVNGTQYTSGQIATTSSADNIPNEMSVWLETTSGQSPITMSVKLTVTDSLGATGFATATWTCHA